ncbi:hypothetical protein MMC14_010157 [Varicellaria rhodocarpa]|nr:hypothetical protein [Varicellaria rhodocarpa]
MAPEALKSRVENMSFYPINRDVPLHERARKIPWSNLDLTPKGPRDTRFEEEIRQAREDLEDEIAREVADAIHHREEWPPAFHKLLPAGKNRIISKWDPKFKYEICSILRCTQDTVNEHLKRVRRPCAIVQQQEDKDRHWQAIITINDGTMRHMVASLKRRRAGSKQGSNRRPSKRRPPSRRQRNDRFEANVPRVKGRGLRDLEYWKSL